MQLTAQWAGTSIRQSQTICFVQQTCGQLSFVVCALTNGDKLQLNNFIHSWEIAAQKFKKQSKIYQLYP